jgi:phosphatidylserine/phosphatidylglycerophosphate/cardiolipin synthase-like enzyme
VSRKRFEAAVAGAVTALGPAQSKALVGMLAGGRSRAYILHAVQIPAAVPSVVALLDAAEAEELALAEIAAYLRGFVAGWTRHRQVEVRTVWSGPATPGVPVRATAQVLAEVVREAKAEFIAMTYSARAFPPLTRALQEAVGRGVRVDIVVETRIGAAGLLDGPEPADAFAAVPGVRLWHWPLEEREYQRARQHAKIAVADRSVLFLGSANLTASGARLNIEAGVLVRGGSAPQRAAEHVQELQRRGVLRPLD